jgi:peptidyl-prolyl cis-trans isomerase SurA
MNSFFKFFCIALIDLILISASIALCVEREKSKVVDRIVAIVNDDIVTLSEVEEILGPYAEKVRAYGYVSGKEKEMLFDARKEIIEQLIDKKLTDQEIEKAGITVSEQEIDSQVEHVKEKNFMTDEEFREGLDREGLTLKKYRQQMKKRIQRQRLLDYKVKSKLVITQDDIKAYYEEHRNQYSEMVEYHLRNIILKVSDFDGEEEKNETRLRMEALRERLKKGESFEMLARLYSESSLADSGGDLGLFKLAELSQQIRNAIKDLPVGGYTDVLSTDQGYQMFFIEDIVKTPGKTFEQASSEIEEELYNDRLNEALKSWLDNLRKEAHIKIIF